MKTLNTTKSDSRYSKLLNNLLDIKGIDQTIFTKVNNTDSFDMTTKFGENVSDKIIYRNIFTISLQEQDLEVLLSDIKESDDPEEIINFFEEAKERLFVTNKLLLRLPDKFIETKNKLIEKLDLKIQKSQTRWKQFKRKALDINIQDNVWPLHVATLFVSVKTDRRELYAPLLLKEIEIDVKSSKVTIKSADSWKINEKLIFLLNDAGFTINEELNIKDMELPEILEVIGSELNVSLSTEMLLDEYVNLKSKQVKNQNIEFLPGVVMGIFKPSGGNLRKTMMKIIDSDEVDGIIDVDPDKNTYEKRLNTFIIDDSYKLFRIQESNYSQDKALSSALLQDTIIWGPPGTGKSQVIANIIANVLMKNKSAIIMSQKKAALDVLKKRLGKVSAFSLFVLNDNKMIKSEFYRPLQDFIEMVENSTSGQLNRKKKIISSNEREAIKNISDAKKNNQYKPALKALEIFENNTNLIDIFVQLDEKMIYPESKPKFKVFLEEFTSTNSIVKKGLIFKRYEKRIKLLAQKAHILLAKVDDLNLNDIKKIIPLLDTTVTENILNASLQLVHDSSYQSDESYITAQLGKNIMAKINHWRNNDEDMFKDYKKFANAVRAGRRLAYKFVNDHMEIIRELFPVIITTPETSFINWEKNSFDYAVIDESSQMFLEIGLPILYLAKIKVLAGDTKQMQPSRWFATRDASEDEEDVAENAESLLDYAFDKGVFQVMLDQNYRSSSASLMSFSAKNFYKSQLEVIDNILIKEDKPIEVINIKGIWEKGTNLKEAKKVISIANKEINNYDKIILLTFNSSQRQLIEKMILEDNLVLQNALDEETLMIRNIENIQGDEADLVIASVVYDSTTNMGSTYVSKQGGKNALNVAISRAKHKMIVIKSVTSETIKSAKSEDFKVFKEWLDFLDLSPTKQTEYSKPKYKLDEMEGDVDSSFEQDVIDYMKNKIFTTTKLNIVKQYEVGSKRIDIAFIDPRSKFILGVEVDGYKWHGGQGYNKYLEDFSRQEFLENKGYPIYRITEIEWKLNKKKVVNQIQAILNK